jgi:hypothetical protein
MIESVPDGAAVVREDDDPMSRTAIPLGRPESDTFVSVGRSVQPDSRPEPADFNFGLLGALVACVAFWGLLLALTLNWLM